MAHISSNSDVNKIIDYIDGNIEIKNPCGMKRLKSLITSNPNDPNLAILRDYLYTKLIDNSKNVLQLENELLKQDYMKQERRLNIFRSILNCNFDYTVAYWSSLLGLTEKCDSMYDVIRSYGLYADLDYNNVFYQELNKFIKEEKIDIIHLNSISRNKREYPTPHEIMLDYKKSKKDVKNCTKELGRFGELCSFRFSKQELRKAGKDDLADRSIWVSRDIGDFLGFDQTTFDENEEELIMEVKATDSKNFEKEKDNFYITRNEFEVMKKMKDEYKYLIVRVYIDETGSANLHYLRPNDDMSVEYGDIKYEPKDIIKPSKTQYEYKRVPKRKVYKLEENKYEIYR